MSNFVFDVSNTSQTIAKKGFKHTISGNKQRRILQLIRLTVNWSIRGLGIRQEHFRQVGSRGSWAKRWAEVYWSEKPCVEKL